MEITREDVKEFRNTINGKRKYLWLKIGVIIDLVFTLSVCLLEIFSDIFSSSLLYYLVLYVLLIIVVVGAEFIGTYFGALEQYVISKKMKERKEIDYMNDWGVLWRSWDMLF